MRDTVREERTNELISVVLLLTPSHRQACVGRPARIYLQQFCTDAWCSLEDRPEAMDNRDKWRERERERECVCQGNPCSLSILNLCMVYVIFLWNQNYTNHIWNMKTLNIMVYIHINSKSIVLSGNCSNKQHMVVWLAVWVLWRSDVFIVSASVVGNGMCYRVNIFKLNICVNLLNIFTKREFSFEMFVVVCCGVTISVVYPSLEVLYRWFCGKGLDFIPACFAAF